MFSVGIPSPNNKQNVNGFSCKCRELCESKLYSRLRIRYARVNSIRERSHTDSARFVCASAATRTCGRAGARTVIYVLIHTSRHAQFAYVEGVYSAKQNGKASVCMCDVRACGRVETHTTRGGYAKKDQDVRGRREGVTKRRSTGTREGLTKRRERERRR